MPPYDRPRRIPRAVDLVLVPLQPNQPPACCSHAQKRHNTTEDHTQDSISQSASRNDHTQPARCEHDQKDRQSEMKWPGMVLEMSTEDREKTEDFGAEQSQTEDVCCRWQSRGEDCAGHQGCICRERSWESVEDVSIFSLVCRNLAIHTLPQGQPHNQT